MNRHKTREKLMTITYQQLLIKGDFDEIVSDNFQNKVIDEYSVKIINFIKTKQDDYIEYINNVLEEWTFDRLGYIEQAILLLACAEFDCKETYASVIIDEAINLCKEYCGDDTYKLINGVLDKL